MPELDPEDVARRILALPPAQRPAALRAFRAWMAGRPRKRLSIIECLEDPALFGSLDAFRDLSTWTAWLTWLKALYGLPLADHEQAIFRKATSRTRYEPPPGGFREGVCVTGVQSGKVASPR